MQFLTTVSDFIGVLRTSTAKRVDMKRYGKMTISQKHKMQLLTCTGNGDHLFNWNRSEELGHSVCTPFHFFRPKQQWHSIYKPI